jgi:hypothetical protein
MSSCSLPISHYKLPINHVHMRLLDQLNVADDKILSSPFSLNDEGNNAVIGGGGGAASVVLLCCC